MRLSRAERAIIEERKVRDYLLSPTHSVGRFKAAFFVQMGYAQERWEELERDLREQHLTQEAEEIGETRYGRKYRIRGPLTVPNGRKVELVSIWIVRRGETVPRFVTAYPEGS
ncbi:MAG: DUF6883 domain-containing protein [Candidatus Bipolaricaulia bacterium]